MRWLLHLASILLFALGVLFAKGWLVNADLADVLACIAGGLACWAAALFTPPVVPR